MSQFVTGEAVALDLRPAALPSRLVAGLIDATAQAGLLAVLLLLVGAANQVASGAAIAALVVIVLLGVLAGYPILFETLWRGRTPGKAAMGLRVVRDDGGPVTFRQALVRGLTGMFVERPGVTLFAGAVVCSLLNSRSKRIGDVLAGTVVLRERVAVRGGAVAVMPPPLAAWATEADLAGLPDDLAASVRTFVARSPQLTDAAREELGSQLVAAVAAVVSPPPPPGTPGWAYLAAVLAERRSRAQDRLTPAPALALAKPAPTTPAPVMPAPATPTPMTPAPATPTPDAPAPVPIPVDDPTPTGGFAPPG